MDVENARILLERSITRKKGKFAPNMKDSEFFEYFCAECILYPMNLGADEIRNGIVDGGGDGGIDSFYVFLNKELLVNKDFNVKNSGNTIDIHIIQSKYTEGFKPNAIISLKDSIKAIFSLKIDANGLRKYFRPSMITKVLDLRRAMDLAGISVFDLNINVYYCTKCDKPSELQ